MWRGLCICELGWGGWARGVLVGGGLPCHKVYASLRVLQAAPTSPGESKVAGQPSMPSASVPSAQPYASPLPLQRFWPSSIGDAPTQPLPLLDTVK